MPSPKHKNLHSFVLFHAAARNLAVAAEIVLRDVDYDPKRKRQLQHLLDDARLFVLEVDRFARGEHTQPRLPIPDDVFFDQLKFAVELP